jgi:NADH-quinone oxidoreductase subunit J
MSPIFYALSLFICLSACGVILAKNPIYSVLSFICCLFGIGGLYLMLNAPFLAIVHIIVYAGAIMVLFLFMLMLMSPSKEKEPKASLSLKLIGSIFGLLILLLLGVWACLTPFPMQLVSQTAGTASQLGQLLFTNYSVPFELTSMLFLSAVVSIVMFGKKS